ncbi:hypothetical protein O6H91_14G079700 [Diphasiastrum complanatum]|uniref:Uncharacterized protein n=1 Tax=Diphasiastrum complanatum TaxID=34168 RepID=A0ACC2BRC8_DIPCM|nr:hypothetical protein O6H91_14G079700 [Diphasiastrum complanatum]
MAAPNGQASGVRTHFKTPEGRYKLSREKTYPTGILHYSHGKVVTQVLLAHLKDRPPAQTNATSTSSSSSTGMRFPAVRLLGAGNGSRALNFVGGNGFTSKLSSGVKSAASGVTGTLSNGPTAVHFDGEGAYIMFNVGDAIFVSDYNSPDKDPIKSIHFTSSNPVSLAFDSEAKDGHDLLIGLSSGDVYSASLRLQLQDSGKKLVGAAHYNKDGSLNSSRCTAVSWIPNSEGLFVVAHADGNLYVYDKTKDASGDASFPPVKEQAQFSVVHAKSSKSNPISRWHICQGSINGLSFSMDGMYLATVGRDGYLRIFDYAKEQLVCGSKSYFGAVLCCAFSLDGKYILTGGEDDLVQVWSMEDRAVVAWGEGHGSWVSGVAFDPFWAPPSDSAESITYRFGSVGQQDTQLLLWDLAMDEVVMPLRRLTSLNASPSRVGGTGQASAWDSTHGPGVLLSSPLRKEVPKLAPVMAHRVDLEPLSGLIFSKESILTACHEGHIKVWDRPSQGGSSPSSSEILVGSIKDRQVSKNGTSYHKP